MRRRTLTLGLAAAGLAAPAVRAQPGGGPLEGRHFQRLAQPLPAAPGRIEVVEFFYYRCPHCASLDPALEQWAKQQAADVSLRRVHVGGSAQLKLHQRMFFALEAMGALKPVVHAGIFNAFHAQRIDANDEAAAAALVGRLGVDAARFRQTLASFGVQSKVAQANKLADSCGIEQVPSLVVAGRWRTVLGMGAAPGSTLPASQHTLAVVDALIKQARNGKVS